MSERRFPSLESLRVFEACGRLGSFTRAARELGVTQGAVSLRIRNLEADLGVSLFLRERPIRLSPSGFALAASVAAGLAVMRQGVADIRREKTLRMTVTPTFAARWLLPRLAELKARAQLDDLEVDVGTDLRPLGELGYDLAIRSGTGPWAADVATRLFAVERTPMMAPGLAATLPRRAEPKDLAGKPAFPDSNWTRWFEAAGAPGVGLLDLGARLPTQDLMAEAALAGEGVALLSPTLFATQLAKGALVAPFDTVLSGPESYFLVRPAGPCAPELARLEAWVLQAARPVEPT